MKNYNQLTDFFQQNMKTDKIKNEIDEVKK